MDVDAKLIRRVVAGETTCFRALIERHQRGVFRFVLNLVGDRQEAEDLAQEVFLAAFRHLSRFDARRSRFSTWLFVIARNRCSNWLRDNAVGFESSSKECADPGPASDQRLLGQELERAFARLPLAQRTAFLLAEVEGLSHAEIAAIEGVRQGTVKSRVHRARRLLQGLLQHVREDVR